MNLNIRISGMLEEHVRQRIDGGAFENVSEYVRSLIRADRERAAAEGDARLRAELRLAFNTPDDDYHVVTPTDIYQTAAKSD